MHRIGQDKGWITKESPILSYPCESAPTGTGMYLSSSCRHGTCSHLAMSPQPSGLQNGLPSHSRLMLKLTTRTEILSDRNSQRYAGYAG